MNLQKDSDDGLSALARTRKGSATVSRESATAEAQFFCMVYKQ